VETGLQCRKRGECIDQRSGVSFGTRTPQSGGSSNQTKDWNNFLMITKSSKPTLLCVDDNQTSLHVRTLVLESAGYSVLVASDFATAMGLFSSSAVDLVLTDHVMEDGSGTELAAAMKRFRPDVPIAIISGLVEAPEGIEPVS